MHTTTARDALRSAIVAAVTLLVLVAACSTPERARAYTCGTYDRPPIAVDEQQCRAAAPGAAWYSGWADDLDEPDERPVIGEPLDEDWYDPIAQADLDDHRVHTGTGHSAPRVSTPPPTTRSAPTRDPAARTTTAPRTRTTTR